MVGSTSEPRSGGLCCGEDRGNPPTPAKGGGCTEAAALLAHVCAGSPAGAGAGLRALRGGVRHVSPLSGRHAAALRPTPPLLPLLRRWVAPSLLVA